jgi:hypothetical protein
VTDPNAPDPFPGADPAVQLADRLLRAAAAIKGARGVLDSHRTAIAAFTRFDNYSADARLIAACIEASEKSLDFAHREVAQASERLAAAAAEDARHASPELDAGDGAKGSES